MSGHPGARAALRVGDRVRMDDRLHTLVGLSGTTVRLLDEARAASLVLLPHLLASEGFELIGHGADQGRMPPFALFDIVPEREAAKAVAWERHVTEVEFGKPLDAPQAIPAELTKASSKAPHPFRSLGNGQHHPGGHPVTGADETPKPYRSSAVPVL